MKNLKMIALFTFFTFISVGLGLMFGSIGVGMVSFGVLSAWVMLVVIGVTNKNS